MGAGTAVTGEVGALEVIRWGGGLWADMHGGRARRGSPAHPVVQGQGQMIFAI